jgi:hypothetical protein
MVIDKIPKVFFNAWLWVAIAAGLIVIHYFFGKPPPSKKIAFFEKHKRAIARTTDIFLILVILFVWLSLTYMAISRGVVKPMLKGTHIPTSESELAADSVALFAVSATALSGWSSVLIGCLSVFQSNLTRHKRPILAVVSVLPIGFTILAVLAARLDKPETIWPMVEMGLWNLAFCWLFNGPAIVAGQHFFRVVWLLMKKLTLASGEFPQ